MKGTLDRIAEYFGYLISMAIVTAIVMGSLSNSKSTSQSDNLS